MSFAALVIAIYLALRLGDRVRLINWHTVLPLYVVLYLSGMLWALGLIYSCLDGALQWQQYAGMATLFCLLEVTKHSWLNGVPDVAKTIPADLGDAEMEHQQ